MAELENESQSTPIDRGPLFYIGAFGLITVMTVETIAVIGRHLGWPLLGAIEMIQAAILLSACAATVIATLNRAHATVHLLTDRLSPTWRALLARLASLLATLFFIGLAAGAFWLTSDFWLAHEESEVLHISFRPLRVISALAALGVAAIFTYRAFRRTRDSR